MRFDEIELHGELLEAVEAMNFKEMTPVQESCIPVLLEGRDLIGCAQTGTGKTAAYTLPLLDRLTADGNPDNKVKAIIIVPTRELAQQVDQIFQGFSYFLSVSTLVVYGGGDGKEWDVQRRGMQMGADVVIATPGRLISHLLNSHVDLSGVEYLILDEADRMLDMGFSEDIMKIISFLPKKRQTVMFSATLPPKIRELARSILTDPAEVSIAVSKPNEAIRQSAYICHDGQKIGIIQSMFSEPTGTKTIIFASSKLKVKELAHVLKRMKFNVAPMHSDLEQARREEVMLDFKNGKIDILVATDIVARGIDIDDIGLVVNYDVPFEPEDYIHRIGRTARADADGAAITFVGDKDQGKFHRIEQFIEREIEKLPLPEIVGEGPEYAPERDRGGRGGHGRGDRGGRGKGRGGRDGRGGGRSDKPRREKRSDTRTDVPEEVQGAMPAGEQGAESRQEDRQESRSGRRSGRGRRRRAAQGGNSAENATAGSPADTPADVNAAPSEGASREARGGEKRKRRHRGGRHRRKNTAAAGEGAAPQTAAPETAE